jgi:hypothetical protein
MRQEEDVVHREHETQAVRPAFDPFGSRLARDIRNGMSSALVESLTNGDADFVEKAARRWLGAELPPACRFYVQDRLARYRAAVEKIRRQGAPDRLRQAILLWNEGLIFETHEVLEAAWLTAAGGRREALKGLIQAAGAFVHAAHGNRPAARGLALRARSHLQKHGRHLTAISNLEELMRALGDPGPVPPRLVVSASESADERSPR